MENKPALLSEGSRHGSEEVLAVRHKSNNSLTLSQEMFRAILTRAIKNLKLEAVGLSFQIELLHVIVFPDTCQLLLTTLSGKTGLL